MRVDLNYDWKNESTFDGLDVEMVWWDEALSSELSYACDVLIIFAIVCWMMYPEPEALSYEIFMWGDIGFMTDVRYYGVAPHWYFRPFMAWLIACPHHKTGVFGLLYFFFVLFYQPVLHGVTEQNNYNKKLKIFSKRKVTRKTLFSSVHLNPEINIYYQFTFWVFIMSCMYATSFLPYGRFYNRLGGNIGMLSAYMYIFVYLGFPPFRRPLLLEFFLSLNFSRIYLLNNYKKNSN